MSKEPIPLRRARGRSVDAQSNDVGRAVEVRTAAGVEGARRGGDEVDDARGQREIRELEHALHLARLKLERGRIRRRGLEEWSVSFGKVTALFVPLPAVATAADQGYVSIWVAGGTSVAYVVGMATMAVLRRQRG